MGRAIKNARDNWEPVLEKLVVSIRKKFSAAFDRIGCAREIRISRHEGFDKWTINILVKFHEKERLQLLTAQRQSEEARSSFSLVDEINRGMDIKAERAVTTLRLRSPAKPIALNASHHPKAAS